MSHDAESIFNKIKDGNIKYAESIHCIGVLQSMLNVSEGTVSSFCVKHLVAESTFHYWVSIHPLFRECYHLGKMFARENWESRGRELQDKEYQLGTISHDMEYWRTIGWSRFGVGKTSRVRLDLDPKGTPMEHYNQLLSQARTGDFTAGEIKQLMEAINVGLNAHQVFTLQEQINELKSELDLMNTNKNVQNTFAAERLTKTD